MEETRRNGLVFKKSPEIVTSLEDMENFKAFKVEILGRIEKLEKIVEEDIKKLRAVKKVEYTK